VVSDLLNRSFTFRSSGAPHAEIVRFLAIFALAYVANLAMLIFLVRRVGMHAGLAQVIAGIVYFALSFILSKYFVFSTKRASAAEL